MSTFDGFIREFPDIQVDYFRNTQATTSRRPLAGFLSHVHSDHLVGLDALRSPFVYCSAATRALVLGLEKYPCRINFAKGILEARKRTYKHLQHLLKPLPFDTPTIIELSPGNRIQVTLFDANHCPGSTMFLFEDENKAALYTGDTRLEPWFVNSLARHPCLVEYTAGLRTIDTVYLDTTFVERDVIFQTKAEGLRDLMRAVSRYPPETIFYLRAWTFGYEDVWVALAKALRSKVHVDAYKMGLYRSLVTGNETASRQSVAGDSHSHLDPVAPGLVGFMCANATHDGCLSASENSEHERVRIHSCEKGLGYCPAVNDAKRHVVWIRPVVCRLPHGRGEVAEVGAGGGGEDLNKEAELEVYGQDEIKRLCELVCTAKGLSQDEKVDLQALIVGSIHGNRQIPLHIDPDDLDNGIFDRDMSIDKIKEAVHEMTKLNQGGTSTAVKSEPGIRSIPTNELPRTITFPYSRHSSYQEQCELLDKLRPRDVWPCTFNPGQWFSLGVPSITIRELFGQYCSGDTFRHDIDAAEKYGRQYTAEGEDAGVIDSQVTTEPDQASYLVPMSLSEMQDEHSADDEIPDSRNEPPVTPDIQHRPASKKLDYPYFYHSPDFLYRPVPEDNEDSQITQLSEFSRERRFASHQAAVINAVGGGEWMSITLESTTDNHTIPDVDLGSVIGLVASAFWFSTAWSLPTTETALDAPCENVTPRQSLDLSAIGPELFSTPPSKNQRDAAPTSDLAGYLTIVFLGADPYICFNLSDGNVPIALKALNKGCPVIKPTKGTGGVCDPGIVKGGGDEVVRKWYIVSTDLNIGKTTWDASQRPGPRGIFVWESTVPLAWTNERLVTVEDGTVGMLWAPKAIWDPTKSQYMVYWSSKFYTTSDSKHTGSPTNTRIRYAYTPDFKTFSKPQTYVGKSSSDTIESTVLPLSTATGVVLTNAATNQTFLRFMKDESKKGVYMDYSTTGILGPFTRPGGDLATIESGVEGPAAFWDNSAAGKAHLLLDFYGSDGYRLYESIHPETNNGWTTSSRTAFPKNLRHGSVLPVTAKQYAALAAKWG